MAAAITGLDRTGGLVGDQVVITGTGFGASQGGGGVTFDGEAATIDSWGTTSITCTIAGSPTEGNVTLEVTANDLSTDTDTFWIFEIADVDDADWEDTLVFQYPGSADSSPEDRSQADSRDINRALEHLEHIKRRQAEMARVSGSVDDGDFLKAASGLWVPRSAAEVRADLALVPGADVQAYDVDLAQIAALANVAGDILYTDAAPEWNRLAKGSDGQVLTLASGLPSWATPAGGGKVVGVGWSEYAGGLATTGLIPHDNTAPQSTEGTATNLSITYTPVDSANKILIMGACLLNGGASLHLRCALFQGTTCIAVGMATSATANYGHSVPFMAYDTAGSGSRTYTVRFGTTTASFWCYLNRDGSSNPLFGSGIAKSWMILLEIEP